MKIVCDDKIPFIRGVFEPYAEVVYLPGGETDAAAVRDADALITRTRTRCDASLLEGSSVRVIATATIGYDHIDSAWCASRGIVWRNAPGCNSWSVGQYVGSVLVTLARRRGLNLSAMTLGVVGAGNVGSKVAEIASLLGMRVLLNDPPRARREGPEAFVSLDRLVEESDIVTLHVPLIHEGGDATWHLFGEEMISRLRPGQILMNSSRGPVVDGDALKAALGGGSLGAAVLDVWEHEPDIDRELMGMLDIATPHIAGYSADGKAAATVASVRTVARCLGLPLADWSPSALPLPDRALEFSLDAGGKSPGEVLAEAILYSYDVMADDRELRARPGLFEKLRGDYPVRREFTAFGVRLAGGTSDTRALLEKAGFNVLETR